MHLLMSALCHQRTSHAMRSVSVRQADVLDRGRQTLGLVALAVRRNPCRIFLHTVVVQDVAVGGGIVITAHPIADELSVLRTVSEPISASHIIHIDTDLSRTWQRTGYQQNRSYEKNIPSHDYSSVAQVFHCGPIPLCNPAITPSCGWYWHHAFKFAMFFWCKSMSTNSRRV